MRTFAIAALVGTVTASNVEPKCTTLLSQGTGVFKSVNDWINSSGLKEFRDNGEKYRGDDGKFEFKITWNDGKSQHWKQSNNPMVHPGCSSNCGVQGYSPIKLAYTLNGWGGLEYSGSSAVLDGTLNEPSWYYAVGSTTPWTTTTGIPVTSAVIPATSVKFEVFSTTPPTPAPTAAPTPAPIVGPLTWARYSGSRMLCSGGKTTSALISSPGGTISVHGTGYAPGCYTTKTIPFATSNWQGVQFRMASTAGSFLAGFGNSNYRMYSDSRLKYGLFTVEYASYWPGMNVYTAGNFNGEQGVRCCIGGGQCVVAEDVAVAEVGKRCTIANYCNGFDCDYLGVNHPMRGWSGGDTVGIMFRLANGGLEIQYRKNGVAFRTLNTADLKTSANNPDYTSIFPLRFETWSKGGLSLDNIQLIVD
jgi:hypothetical protein